MLVYTHHDADGISSAYLYGMAFPNKVDDMIYPTKFGEVNGNGDEIIMLDMRPEEKVALNIDHHPPQDRDTADKLIWKNKPTAAIVLEEYFDEIPDEVQWKAMVGIVGDGQPEKAPLFLWKENPELFRPVESLSEKYNNVKSFSLPCYKYLSSGINGACKMGKPEIAMKELSEAVSPFDLVNNINLNKLKSDKNKEINNIFKYKFKTLRYGPIIFGILNEQNRIASEIATRVESGMSMTSVVLNKSNNKFSIRGDLAPLIIDEMKKIGIECGGHLKYSGGYTDNSEDIKEALRQVEKMLGS